LITEEAIGRVLEAAGPRRGAVAGRRVTDSLKEVDAEGRVLRAVNRERLWRAETPQAFPRELIVAVHRDAAAEGVTESDCAALCERYGVEVVVVEIATPNPKVTRAEDLALVDSLLQRREMGSRLGL
jgi:2-C-methyl-D-erythritol 4-phosphate cytidylyltransferase